MARAKVALTGNSTYSAQGEVVITGAPDQMDEKELDPEVPPTASEDDEASRIQSSVLLSVKDALGLVPEYVPFDNTLIMHINSVFGILFQLGIGPEEGQFNITGPTEQWDDFILDQTAIEYVKSYMYLKVRLLFDPPTTATLYDAFGNQVKELEWRLRVSGDEHRLTLGRDDLNDI